MRLGDLDVLRKNMEFICMGIMAGTEPYNAPLTEIDNAQTVVNEYTKGFADGERSGRHFPLTDEEKAILVRQWRSKGEWIRTGSLGNGNAHYECSECHYGDEHAESQEVPYCWHCGAEMKGGAK